MLMKMMRLDYENIKRNVPASLILMVVAALLSLGNEQTSPMILSALLTLALLLVLMGLNRMLGSAMFGTDGVFAMLLPVSARTRAGSKALIGGLWLGLLLTVFLLIAAQRYAGYDSLYDVRSGFMERTILYMMSIGFSPMTVGFSVALIPTALVLASSIFCTGIMIVQIEINSMVLRRFKGLGLWIITILAASLLGGFFAGLLLLLRKLIYLHLGGVWLVIVILTFLAGTAFLLHHRCARMMETKMNIA